MAAEEEFVLVEAILKDDATFEKAMEDAIEFAGLEDLEMTLVEGTQTFRVRRNDSNITKKFVVSFFMEETNFKHFRFKVPEQQPPPQPQPQPQPQPSTLPPSSTTTTTTTSAYVNSTTTTTTSAAPPPMVWDVCKAGESQRGPYEKCQACQGDHFFRPDHVSEKNAEAIAVYIEQCLKMRLEIDPQQKKPPDLNALINTYLIKFKDNIPEYKYYDKLLHSIRKNRNRIVHPQCRVEVPPKSGVFLDWYAHAWIPVDYINDPVRLYLFQYFSDEGVCKRFLNDGVCPISNCAQKHLHLGKPGEAISPPSSSSSFPPPSSPSSSLSSFLLQNLVGSDASQALAVPIENLPDLTVQFLKDWSAELRRERLAPKGIDKVLQQITGLKSEDEAREFFSCDTFSLFRRTLETEHWNEVVKLRLIYGKDLPWLESCRRIVKWFLIRVYEKEWYLTPDQAVEFHRTLLPTYWLDVFNSLFVIRKPWIHESHRFSLQRVSEEERLAHPCHQIILKEKKGEYPIHDLYMEWCPQIVKPIVSAEVFLDSKFKISEMEQRMWKRSEVNDGDQGKPFYQFDGMHYVRKRKENQY